MMCSHCKKAVTEGLLKEENVEKVTVDLEDESVEVIGEALEREVISNVITDLGYEVIN